MNKGKQLSEESEKPAESGERRGLAKGNPRQTATAGTPRPGKKVSTGLWGVREAARRDKHLQMTALLHHIDERLLLRSYEELKREASPGVEGRRWKDYREGLLNRLKDLCDRLHKGSYHAQPSKRVYIEKEDGSERKLGIAALEDKIVQQATTTVLNAIYEEDFVGFSYGFRPGRDPHQALDALYVGLTERPINWIVELDIQSYLESASYCPLVYDGGLNKSG